MSSLTLITTVFLYWYKLSILKVFETPRHNVSLKSDYLVITNVQMTSYFIDTKYINNWINHHIIITNFLRQDIDSLFRNWLWQMTSVISWEWIFKFRFINWSIYWCLFWMEIINYTCICVMSNWFYPNYRSKLSWLIIWSIHK